MARDPRRDPLPGDQLLHPDFGRGAVFHVMRVRLVDPGRPYSPYSRYEKRGSVSCSIVAVNGGRIEQRGRVYALGPSWARFMRSAYILHFHEASRNVE